MTNATGAENDPSILRTKQFDNSKQRRWESCKKGHRTDCTFLVKMTKESTRWRTFTCHKIIMATASEVFDRMLYGEMQDNAIYIEDVTCDVFAKFLQYIYTYELSATEIDTLQCLALFAMGHKYMMQDLIDECVTILNNRNIWTLPDILPIYKHACLYEHLPLITKCYEKIRINYTHLLQHNSLYDLDLPELKRMVVLLSQNTNFNFTIILRGLENYGKYHQLDKATSGDENFEELLELKRIARILDFSKQRNDRTTRPSSYLDF